MRLYSLLLPVSAAALSILILPACAQKDDVSYDVIHTVEVTAYKGSDETRALDLSDDNKTLTAPWEEGETVEVYQLNTLSQSSTDVYVNVGTLTAQSSGYTTTLKGVIRGTFIGGESLMFSYRHGLLFDYRGQDGSLDYIADNCDYATAYADVAEVVSGTLTLSESLSFSSMQCVIRFSLADVDGNPINASKLTIQSSTGSGDYTTDYLVQYVDMSKRYVFEHYNSGPIEVNLSTPSNVVYVALSGAQRGPLNNLTNVPLSLVATVGDYTYSCVKSNFSFELNKYYLYDVTMTKPLTDPDVDLETDSSSRYGQATVGSLE